jgi:GNAT superfamily N-acetyltransferase
MQEGRGDTAGVVIDGYRPGALAAVVKLHMDYYAPSWNFGLAFETKVAGELAEFLARRDPDRDLFLAAYEPGGDVVGTITIDAIDAAGTGAHLRWFITGTQARGAGLGRTLFNRAFAFCDARGYDAIYLTTFAGLDAAKHLYEGAGFSLVSENDVDQWQGGVREQRFERRRK